MSTETYSPGTAGVFGRSWWTLLLPGIFAIVLGLLAFTRPAWSLKILVLAFGIYALVEGFSSLFTAVGGWSHRDDRWLLLLQALIGIGIGLVTLSTPGITALVLIFFIAFWALGTGVVKIIVGVRLRREIRGEMWLILGGVASVIFAMFVMMRPLVGALAMVQVIGIYALILGASEVALAFKVHRARNIPTPVMTGPSYRRVA